MQNNEVDVGQKLKSIIEYVRDCQARVIKGEIMDLRGLDKSVIEVCDLIAELPEAEGTKHETQMNTLIEQLEVLAVAMRDQQAKMQDEEGK